jgi:DNA-binding response OmpR family regulator
VEALMTQTSLAEQQTYSPQPGGPGVLIADDDPQIRDLIYDALSHEGFGRVYLSKDGQECLELLHENLGSIRAVVLDLMMPNLSGAHVLASLVNLKPQSLGVLLLSGHHDSLGALEAKYRDAKAPFYLESLPKPFDVTQLVARIKALLMRGSGPSALDGLSLGRLPHGLPKPDASPGAQSSVSAPAPRPSPAPPTQTTSQPAVSADAFYRLSKQLAAVEGQLAGLNASVAGLRESVDKLASSGN